MSRAKSPEHKNGAQGVLPVFPRTNGHLRSFNVVGLFAGIGGLELGLGRSKHHTLQFCEIDVGATAVLNARFPRIEVQPDITKLKSLPKETTLLAGGFPCQDLSQAGRTLGIAGAQSGLVGEVFRLLKRKRVPWVLLENVPFMLQLARGEAMEVVVSALEALGYNWAYRVVDSRALGVPQRRARVFLLASTEDDPRKVLFADDAGPPPERDPQGLACGFYWTEGIRGLGWAVDAIPTLKGGSTLGIPSPPAILMPDGVIIKPDIRDAERMQGFDEDWTLPAEQVAKRGHRWKLVGNAVTVATSTWLGERLAAPGLYDERRDAPMVRTGAWPTSAWNMGQGRFTATVSAWPRREPCENLHRFLKHEPTLLSEKATAGFLSRTKKAKLRFPPGFLDTVAAHLERVRRQARESPKDGTGRTAA